MPEISGGLSSTDAMIVGGVLGPALFILLVVLIIVVIVVAKVRLPITIIVCCSFIRLLILDMYYYMQLLSDRLFRNEDQQLNLMECM